MPSMAVRHLYLTRHAEPDDEGELTDRGVRQALLLGRRLSDVPLTGVLHGRSRAGRTPITWW
jgi:probable phosphoglycerate mutase